MDSSPSAAARLAAVAPGIFFLIAAVPLPAVPLLLSVGGRARRRRFARQLDFAAFAQLVGAVGNDDLADLQSARHRHTLAFGGSSLDLALSDAAIRGNDIDE